MARDREDANEGSSQAPQAQSTGGFFDDDVIGSSISLPAERIDHETAVQLELNSYRGEIVGNKVAMEWWKERRSKYPILSATATKFLMIPASSVPSEQVFSTAGALVTKKRSFLAPAQVNRLIFLNANSKYYQ